MTIDPRRIRTLQAGEPGTGPVVYWMSRDQRIRDNWALIHAQERARAAERGVVVLFCLAPEFLEAAWRQYSFMLGGLRETCRECLELGIPFVLRRGDPGERAAELANSLDAESLICDFDPLRLKSGWRREAADRIKAPFMVVDAHNVVPCWQASDKQEFAARTIRPRIQRQLDEFLTPFPDPAPQPEAVPGLDLGEPDWEAIESALRVDAGVGPAEWLEPGPRAGRKRMQDFLHNGLARFADKRNDPNADALSHLSPYFHFGQIAPQRAALEVWNSEEAPSSARSAYLEELIIRRELADNYCYYNPAYDAFQGLPNWARATLDKHRDDPRPVIYSYQELEDAATHDDLWNAAQTQMVRTGKMHGYMRMYWAKKILEWSESPEQAIDFAIQLNDLYELDGRDPNGYTGVLWSVGGLHDRGFKERPVFGTVRYMSHAGCRRKFDVGAYVRTWLGS
jgi:deoxyribodipyrimidine photo-lyase